VSAGLLERWRTLAGECADALGQRLIEAWAQPQRFYHDQGHLLWLLEEADRRAPLIADAAYVGYAIWFHDAVYEPGRPDNESRSAEWARGAIANGELAERVADVIEMTKRHHEGDAVGDAALFLDMDIAILGQPREVYRAYAAGVRREFAAFPDAAFAAGRGQFLDVQLALPRLFRTEAYESALAVTARANMTWEREQMRAGRMVQD